MNTWEEVMSDKITVEEMVKDLDRFIKYADMHLPFLRAIRSHLTESDIAHWMDRCHELEAELAEKQTVSREQISDTIDREYRDAEYRSDKYPHGPESYDVKAMVAIVIKDIFSIIVEEE